MQLVEKQRHNHGREEEEMVLTALIVIYLKNNILPAYSPLNPYLYTFPLFLSIGGDPKDQMLLFYSELYAFCALNGGSMLQGKPLRSSRDSIKNITSSVLNFFYV